MYKKRAIVLLLLTALIIIFVFFSNQYRGKAKVLYNNKIAWDTKKLKAISFNRNFYKSIYLADKNDTEGRTVIYERYDNSWLGGVGVMQKSNTSLRYAIGQIESIEPVENSEDLYLTLINPFDDEYLIKGKIILAESNISTDFRKEKVATLADGEPVITPIGVSYVLGRREIYELMKVGDVIIAQFLPENNVDSSEPKKGKNNVPLIVRIIVRRF